jgi:hypothetical protein
MPYPLLNTTAHLDRHPLLHNAVVDVKGHFDAIGNGVADDAAAAQAAITAVGVAGGGTVYFPPGTYSLSTALLPAASNIELRGAGIGATTLKITNANTGGAGDIIRAIKTTPYYTNFAIRDMTLDGTSRTGGAYSNGITCEGFDYATIERVKIISPLGFGIFIGSGSTQVAPTKSPLVRDVIVTGERNGNDSIGGGNHTDGTFEHIRIYDPAGTGFDHTLMVRATLRDIHVIQSLTAVAANWGISSDFGAQDCVIEDCYVEGMWIGYYFLAAAAPSPQSAGQGQMKNLVFRNCTSKISTKNGMAIQGSATYPILGLSVSDCRITSYTSDSSAAPGVEIQEAEDARVYANWIDGEITAAYSLRLNKEGAGVGVTRSTIHDNILDATNALSYTAGDGGLVTASTHIRNNRNFNPQGTASITVTASPFTYTNNDNVPENVHIRSGTVSVIAKNGRTIFVNTDQTVWLEPQEAVTVTYSSAPTMEKDRK